MTDDEKWTQIKRRMQARWGIVPPGVSPSATWVDLADHVRDRAVRVGGQIVDVVRSVAKETTATVSEASEVLQDDAHRVGDQVRSVGGKARTGIDVAKSTLEDLADSVRDGLVDGIAKARSDRDVPKSLAESLGIAAGTVIAAVTGSSSSDEQKSSSEKQTRV